MTVLFYSEHPIWFPEWLNKNGTPAFAGVTVLFERPFRNIGVMPAKAGIPFGVYGGGMEKRFWVYIITDKPYGTLYIGVTNNLMRRIYEHQSGLYKGFSKRYDLKMLVWYEEYPTILDAIQREKRIKKWNREWKIHNLIHPGNPKWQDLSEGFNI